MILISKSSSLSSFVKGSQEISLFTKSVFAVNNAANASLRGAFQDGVRAPGQFPTNLTPEVRQQLLARRAEMVNHQISIAFTSVTKAFVRSNVREDWPVISRNRCTLVACASRDLELWELRRSRFQGTPAMVHSSSSKRHRRVSWRI